MAFWRRRNLCEGRDWLLLHWMLACDADRSSKDGELFDRDRLLRLYGKGATDRLHGGLKAFWRRWHPPLPGARWGRGYHPSMPALEGLSLEAAEDGVARWTPEETVWATEHALHALNGFPDWLADLARVRPAEVTSVLRDQAALETEVPAEKHPPHCVLSRLTRADAAIRHLCVPFVAELLETRNIPNLQVLRQALAVLVRAEDVETLARIAPPAVAAASAAGDRERLLAWLQVWLQADPAAAMTWLEGTLPTMPADDADALVLHVVADLHRYGSNSLRMDRPRFLDLEHAARFLPLLHRHVRRDEDIERHGAYTPGPRDNAQQFRSDVFGAIANMPGAAAYATLRSLADDPSLSAIRDLLTYYAFRRATTDADPKPWNEAAVGAFERTYTKPPQSADDLFNLVIGRLADLRDDAENGDFAPTGLFSPADNESLAQIWLAGQLESRSMGRFQVDREAEAHGLVRPDIRIKVPSHKPVVIEVKWAHKKERSFENLKQALHKQLVGDYMKLRDSRHGILFIVNLAPKRRWKGPGTGTVDFAGLIEALRKEADGIMQADPRDLRLEVVGIELVPRPAPAAKAPAPASTA
ncbi:hypothetical protein [Caenispirillum salinarum]|uniref:hypothetical protein n=1 Tax=Caenispirillum salinarum TaxID=859058 RepID=UPI00384EA1AC